jgi:hypothetical protein
MRHRDIIINEKQIAWGIFAEKVKRWGNGGNDRVAHRSLGIVTVKCFRVDEIWYRM